MDQQTLAVNTCNLPAWVPQRLRKKMAGQSLSFRIGTVPRLAARRPVKIPVSVWAEKNRVVTEGDNSGGWKNDIAPHTVKIMDTFGLPWVNEIWFCKVEQSGGTNTLINCMLWTIDCDPGDIFMLLPTEDISQKVVGKKIIPTMRQSSRIKELVSRAADDTGLKKITLRNSVTFLPAWANSPSSMATFSAKYAFGSEVDKYPKMAGKEADPITLIRKRGRTYRGKVKRLFESTCGDGGFVYQGTMNCHQVWRFDVRCPDCSAYVVMDPEHLIIPEGATPDNIDLLGADYACNACGGVWDDYKHKQAIRSGKWICIKGEENTRPRRVGFHHRAWECLDIPLSEIGAAWLRAKDGDLSAKTAWANGYMAEDYQQERATDSAEEILRLCDDRPRDLVPDAASALVVNVDTQQDGFYYEVAAVGPWDGQTEPTTWLVSKGYLLDFASLVQLAARTWHSAGGKEYRIISGLIDSGGGRKAGAPSSHSRTAEVYSFCKQNPLYKPVKGTGRKTGAPVTYSTLDRYPGTSKAIPGGLRLILLDVHYFKDELARRLQLDSDAPGAFVLYSGYTADQLTGNADADQNDLHDYAKHLCAEYKNEIGLWEHDKKAGRNDWHDCATYRMYHIELLKQWGSLTPDTTTTRPARRVLSKGVSHQ